MSTNIALFRSVIVLLLASFLGAATGLSLLLLTTPDTQAATLTGIGSTVDNAARHVKLFPDGY
jgi:hypothetical protein